MILVIFFAIIAGSATRCCLHTLRRCATLLLLLVALKDAEVTALLDELHGVARAELTSPVLVVR
jgi:predicted membrane channel-forming protein YqfA (hemolysin III family)